MTESTKEQWEGVFQNLEAAINMAHGPERLLNHTEARQVEFIVGLIKEASINKGINGILETEKHWFTQTNINSKERELLVNAVEMLRDAAEIQEGIIIPPLPTEYKKGKSEARER